MVFVPPLTATFPLVALTVPLVDEASTPMLWTPSVAIKGKGGKGTAAEAAWLAKLLRTGVLRLFLIETLSSK